jgi:hypothetical protein
LGRQGGAAPLAEGHAGLLKHRRQGEPRGSHRPLPRRAPPTAMPARTGTSAGLASGRPEGARQPLPEPASLAVTSKPLCLGRPGYQPTRNDIGLLGQASFVPSAGRERWWQGGVKALRSLHFLTHRRDSPSQKGLGTSMFLACLRLSAALAPDDRTDDVATDACSRYPATTEAGCWCRRAGFRQGVTSGRKGGRAGNERAEKRADCFWRLVTLAACQ